LHGPHEDLKGSHHDPRLSIPILVIILTVGWVSLFTNWGLFAPYVFLLGFYLGAIFMALSQWAEKKLKEN